MPLGTDEVFDDFEAAVVTVTIEEAASVARDSENLLLNPQKPRAARR